MPRTTTAEPHPLLLFRLTPGELQALTDLRRPTTPHQERYRSDVIRRLIRDEARRRRSARPKPLPALRALPTPGTVRPTTVLLNPEDRAALAYILTHQAEHEGLHLSADQTLRRLIHDARRAV